MKKREMVKGKGQRGLAPLWLFEDMSPSPDVSSRNAGWLCPILYGADVLMLALCERSYLSGTQTLSIGLLFSVGVARAANIIRERPGLWSGEQVMSLHPCVTLQRYRNARFSIRDTAYKGGAIFIQPLRVILFARTRRPQIGVPIK